MPKKIDPLVKRFGKPRVMYIHFNRIAMQRKDPKVWSIRTSKQCMHAESVMMIDLPLVTIYKPDQKNNPRAFFKCFGYAAWVVDKKMKKEHLILSSQPWGTMPMAQEMDYQISRWLQETGVKKRRA